MLNFGHLVKGKLLFFLIDKYLWRDMLRVCYWPLLLLKLLPTAFSIHWWDLPWKNDYCGVCLMVTFLFPSIPFIFVHWKSYSISMYLFTYYTNMVVWTYYSMGYNLVLMIIYFMAGSYFDYWEFLPVDSYVPLAYPIIFCSLSVIIS